MNLFTQASTRELTYIIFLGMMVSYASSLVLLGKPTLVTCVLSRLLPGISFAMIYAALLTKTNRIARILSGTKKIRTRKLKFMSATAQVNNLLWTFSTYETVLLKTFTWLPMCSYINSFFEHINESNICCFYSSRILFALTKSYKFKKDKK